MVGSALELGFARRLLRDVCGLCLALVLMAPILLGPALGSVLQAIGAHLEHRCECGMVRGKCGCEECEVAESERLDRKQSAVPVIKTACKSDAFSIDDLRVVAIPDALSGLEPTPAALPKKIFCSTFVPRLRSAEAPPPLVPPPRALALS